MKKFGIGLLVIALMMSFYFTTMAEGSGEEAVYSFVVFGDSRIPAYAPYDKNNKDKLEQLVHAVTRYVDSNDNDKPPYEAFFNPNTLKLERIELAGKSEGQSRTITYGRDGWPEVFVDRQGENSRISLLAELQQTFSLPAARWRLR